MSNTSKYSQLIKEKAKELGFLSCGISKAEFLEDEAPKLEKWLNLNHHGEMYYMANHFDMRLNPKLIVDDAKSVISLLFNYYPKETQKNSNLKIAKYAYGKDYHYVLKKKIFKLLEYIRQTIGDVDGRAFVDSAPVLERAWAEKSGLGWVGKNTNLISKKTGSFFFLAELIIDLNLEYDMPTTDHCGNCTKCIDACPTDAIIEPYVINSNKCISYLTIEYKNTIPEKLSNSMDNWIFGCDVCQDVCPWNKFSKPHNENEFQISPELALMTDNDWEDITEDVFRTIFKESAIKRTKIEGLKRNIKATKKYQHQK